MWRRYQADGGWASQAYLQYIDLTDEKRVTNVVKFIDEMDKMLDNCDNWDDVQDFTYNLCFAASMPRRVLQSSQQVMVLTDIPVTDHTSLDALCQTIYSPDTSMKQWRHMIRDGTIKAKTSTVVLLVGNSELPMDKALSPLGQLKKLVLRIWSRWAGIVRRVLVCSVLPHADKETQMENEVRLMNIGFAKAVRELRKHFPVVANTLMLGVHKLFLEKFEYFDFQQGHSAHMIRIVKPVSRYFVPGTPHLNQVGIFHLRSYFLQYLGVVSEMNTWQEMPVRSEPGDVQRAKRQAWVMAHQSAQQLDQLPEQVYTDVEDEYPLVVPSSINDEDSSSVTLDSKEGIPVFIQGRKVGMVTGGDIQVQCDMVPDLQG